MFRTTIAKNFRTIDFGSLIASPTFCRSTLKPLLIADYQHDIRWSYCLFATVGSRRNISELNSTFDGHKKPTYTLQLNGFSGTRKMPSSTFVPAADPVFSGDFYESKTISGLPRDVFCVQDGVTFSIDYARQSEVTSRLSAMLSDARDRGDNVGTDEFEGVRGKMLTEFSFIFTARFSYSSLLGVELKCL